MKGMPTIFRVLCAFIFLCVGFYALRIQKAEPARQNYKPTKEEFAPVAKAVVELIQSRNTSRFVAELAPTVEDYRAVISTNGANGTDKLIRSLPQTVEAEHKRFEEGAKALLERADLLDLDFSKAEFAASVVLPKFVGQSHWNSSEPLLCLRGFGPYEEGLEIVLKANSTNTAMNGEYRVSMGSLLKFPQGWRAVGHIQWLAVPATVAEAKTMRKLMLLDKTSGHQRITDREDPTLRQLGERIAQFLRQRDTNFFQNEIYLTREMEWDLIQKSGRSGPTRQAFEGDWEFRSKEQFEAANSVIKLMAEADIDLKNANIQIEEAALESSYFYASHDSIEGLHGSRLKLKFDVKTNRKSKNNAPLAGIYIVAINSIKLAGNSGDQWRVTGHMHWDKLPKGVIDDKTVATMVFENYVAENRALPPGHVAPDVEFTTLTDKKAMKLSDLRGKVVVLDFWATWCVPCQKPMAELQRIREGHEDWKDKVAIVTLSIDDGMNAVEALVKKRGWTNTFNVWAGEGGWQSKAAKAFRVTAVPRTYILDAKGKIVEGGRLADTVEELLKSAKKGGNLSADGRR